jgi:hypothetical protein
MKLHRSDRGGMQVMPLSLSLSPLVYATTMPEGPPSSPPSPPLSPSLLPSASLSVSPALSFLSHMQTRHTHTHTHTHTLTHTHTHTHARSAQNTGTNPPTPKQAHKCRARTTHVDTFSTHTRKGRTLVQDHLGIPRHPRMMPSLSARHPLCPW